MRASRHSKPQVVHVSSVHPYTDNRIHYRECQTLVKAGYKVTLVAVESQVTGPATGVTVITIPRRRRAARVLLSAPQSIWLALRSGARVVHMHDPELAVFIPLFKLAGRRVIYDAHEDLPAQMKDKPYYKRPFRALLSLASAIVVRIASAADTVVCATEKIAESYPTSKAAIVHNYPPLEDIGQDSAHDDIQERANQVVFVGGINEIRGAYVMVDALASTEFPDDWQMVIAGSIAPSLLESLGRQPGWERVDYRGQIPPDEARKLIRESKLGLVLYGNTIAHRDALPTKMFEYLAEGVPVIASDFPLWRGIIENTETGTVVPWNSPEGVASAVRRYASNVSLLQEHSANARTISVEKLNWQSEGETLKAVYRQHLTG